MSDLKFITGHAVAKICSLLDTGKTEPMVFCARSWSRNAPRPPLTAYTTCALKKEAQ